MSEKDQEKLINDAPLDGAPHFDVAAPAFVPKEASEDVVVSEPGGIPGMPATEMKEETTEAAISDTVEIPDVGEPTVEKDLQAVAPPQSIPPFQPVAEAPYSLASERADSQAQPGPAIQIQQTPPVRKPMDPADKKAIRFALGILVGLLIGGISGYLIGQAAPSSSQARKQDTSLSADKSGSPYTIDLEQLTSEDAESNFSWEQSDVEKLQFLTGEDDGMSPEEMVEAYGKANAVQFDDGELKLNWDNSSYNKEVRAIYTKNGKQLQLSKFEFNQYEKDLIVEDNFADGLKVGDSEIGVGGTSYKELLDKYGDGVNLSVRASDYSGKVEMLMDFKKKNGDYVDLTFVRQSNGDFLLSSKDSY